MTSSSQLLAVQQKIQQVSAKMDSTKKKLAKASADNDSKQVGVLRHMLITSHKALGSLLEHKTKSMREQASGQHILLCQAMLQLQTSSISALSVA